MESGEHEICHAVEYEPFLAFGFFFSSYPRKESDMKRILISLFLGVFLFLVCVCMASAAKMAPGPSKDAITGKAYAGSEKCKSCHKAKYDS